jgi:hypothetical protein
MSKKKNLLQETNLYGIIPKNNTKFNDKDLYAFDNFLPSVMLKKIQIWFGIPKGDMPVCLLGMKCWYINNSTGEKKESEFHGCQIKSDNCETKELEVKEQDYFTKINLGISYYIIHFKITTKKGDFIEFGEIKEEYEKKLELNPNDNIISSFFGYASKYGVRSLGINYLSRMNFVFFPIIDIFRLRYAFKKYPKLQEKYAIEENYNQLDIEMKYVYRVCLLPPTILSYIIKYL